MKGEVLIEAVNKWKKIKANKMKAERKERTEASVFSWFYLDRGFIEKKEQQPKHICHLDIY